MHEVVFIFKSGAGWLAATQNSCQCLFKQLALKSLIIIQISTNHFASSENGSEKLRKHFKREIKAITMKHLCCVSGGFRALYCIRTPSENSEMTTGFSSHIMAQICRNHTGKAVFFSHWSLAQNFRLGLSGKWVSASLDTRLEFWHSCLTEEQSLLK